MTVEGIQVVHVLPGRVRLKAAKVKGDPVFAQQAEARLSQVPGIEKVEAKPTTGSILIFYSLAELLAQGALAALTDGFSELFPEIETEALELGFESLVEHLAAGNPEGGGNLVGFCSALNTEVGRVLGGVDLKLLVPMTLLFMGVRSLLTAEKLLLPVWYDYLWFAFSTFIMLNRPTIEGGH